MPPVVQVLFQATQEGIHFKSYYVENIDLAEKDSKYGQQKKTID